MLNRDHLEPYDDEKSIDLNQARKRLRGRKGPAAIEVVRRWANPKKGCRPQGEIGPVIVLPAVKIAGEWRTMPSWVEAFSRERERVGSPELPPSIAGMRTNRQRQADLKRADARLAEMGMDKIYPNMGRAAS